MKNSSMSSFDTPTTLQHEKEKGNDFREKGDHVKPRTIEIKEAVTKQLESKPSQDINESAEAFIKKFRQQLLIQRLESIENYEQMLERGL
ncbi:hypothetical protein RGQ29_020820 [Quercus rubra]|uniref:DUF761 domain-containing protein n=1 Tax=Quercus rubra TaxID=3512 RepID=A0AAN7FC85_QUERU|nr:hypothetical protein RGQ29_020820 [Quercus rubra]